MDLRIEFLVDSVLQDLGAASGSRRPTCMVLIKKHDDYEDLFDQCEEELKGLPLPI